MQAMSAKAQQERWNSTVRQYAESWQRNNVTADRNVLEAHQDEAEQFFELNVPQETRQAVGKTFDDFFREMGEQIQWV
jgi:hypothetical protein